MICGIGAFWVLWPRGSQEAREHIELGTAAPPPAPGGSPDAANVKATPSPDLERMRLQKELERLAGTQQYRDMIGRQQRGEQLTKEDMDLLLEAGDIRGKMIDEPELKKSTTYPPQDAQAKQMWQWWRKMRDADPGFEYKRPITFYGKVVDDAGSPIADVRVVMSIAGSDGNKEVMVKSDEQGLFSIKNSRGKYMTVGMDKRGYGHGPQSGGKFEFAEFFSDSFYEPDESKPVVFVLLRLTP